MYPHLFHVGSDMVYELATLIIWAGEPRLNDALKLDERQKQDFGIEQKLRVEWQAEKRFVRMQNTSNSSVTYLFFVVK